MIEEEKTPETQDTSEEELLLGKYKSQEEMEAAFKEMERKQTELSEALDREQRLNSLLASEEKQEPEVQAEDVNLTEYFDEDQAKIFQKALKAEREKIISQTQQYVQAAVSNLETKRTNEDKFYREYKELRGFEREVDEEASRLAQELGDRRNRIPFETLAQEVAKRTKARLAEQRVRLSKSTLHVEGAASKEPEPSVKEESVKPQSEDERLAEFFKDEVPEFDKKKLNSLGG